MGAEYGAFEGYKPGMGHMPRAAQPPRFTAGTIYGSSEFAADRAAEFIEQEAALRGVGIIGVSIEEGERWPIRPTLREDLRRLDFYLPSNGVRIPETRSAQLLLDGTITLSDLPAKVVAKKKGTSYGEHKHLLDGKRRTDRFIKWLQEFPEEAENWDLQEYIASPVDRPVSFRVLADATGAIIGSQLMHGVSKDFDKDVFARVEAERLRKRGWSGPEYMLSDPNNGRFYLAPKPLASNRVILERTCKYSDRVSGGHTSVALHGGGAVLDPIPRSHSYSKLEVRLLEELGLMVSRGRAVLPHELAVNASAIAYQLTATEGRRSISSLYVGIDYVPDKDGNYYFLEANRNPSLVTVRDMFGGVERVSEPRAFRWTVQEVLRRLQMADDRVPVQVAHVRPKEDEKAS